MKTAVFDSHLLPDGHLYCPEELAQNRNARFRVLVTLQDDERTAVDLELAAAQGVSDDFLSAAELKYYLALEDA
jgi:hypothetical protein